MNVRIFWVRVMKCMCAQTRPRFILSSERVFGGMEFEPMLTPREKSPLPENVPRGGSNPRRCGQWAQALLTELFRPQTDHLDHVVVTTKLVNTGNRNTWCMPYLKTECGCPSGFYTIAYICRHLTIMLSQDFLLGNLGEEILGFWDKVVTCKLCDRTDATFFFF